MKKKKQVYYLVLEIEKERPLSIGGEIAPLALSWTQGMIGVCPVFDNKKDALEYANNKEELLCKIETRRN